MSSSSESRLSLLSASGAKPKVPILALTLVLVLFMISGAGNTIIAEWLCKSYGAAEDGAKETKFVHPYVQTYVSYNTN
jgi:hypothetical protein